MKKWEEDIRSLYTEMWKPGSPNLPGNAQGAKPPKESQDSLRYRGWFGSADNPPNISGMSVSSGQNPTEQEETMILGSCVDESLVDEIFGSVSEFQRLIEDNGDEFEYNGVIVTYDPDEDIHYFFRK